MDPKDAPPGVIPQGVDLNVKMNVEKKRAEFNKIQDVVDQIEKILTKNNLTMNDMGMVWDFLQKRQQHEINKQQVKKTDRTKLQIIDQKTGQPINI